MPCHEPDHQDEIESMRVANLLLYVNACMGIPSAKWIVTAATDVYLCEKRTTPLLCEAIKRMDDTTREVIVYNAHSKQSRDLADWWENHQAHDEKKGT